MDVMPEPVAILDPDLPLVKQAKEGDFGAFEEIVSRYEGRIYQLARRIVPELHDAEEVVQETFLSVVEHLGAFRGEAVFRNWILRIATNAALKVLRKRRGRVAVSLDGGAGEEGLPHPEYIAPWREDPVELAGRGEVRALLEDALLELDEKYRLVFVLRDVEELSTEEAARALGISESNVKIRLMRARLMLRERLTRALGDEGRRAAPHAHGS